MHYSILKKLVRKWHQFWALHRESYYTEEEARRIAVKNDLEKEFEDALDFGLTPDEALEEWDIYPYGETKKEVISNC